MNFDKYKCRPTDCLTRREIEYIIQCVSELSNIEIAAAMGVSARTVEGFAKRVYGKIGVKNRVGVVLYALVNGLVQL